MSTSRQVAALPVRRAADGRCEVMLITSRETRRWVIPKGWPWVGQSDARTASGEAWEEAGIEGVIQTESVGSFTYQKRKRLRSVEVSVDVFLLEVTREADDWPEREERQRVWFSPEQAAAIVDEPELGALILRLARAARSSSRRVQPLAQSTRAR